MALHLPSMLGEPVVYELTPSDGAWTFNQLYTVYDAYEGSFAKLPWIPPAGSTGQSTKAAQRSFS